MAETKHKPEIPERFRVARRTLWFDRFMTHFITLGGVGIIVAVSLIFVFIFIQVVPLFKGASVEAKRTLAIPAGNYQAIGSDEWSELPFFVTANAAIHVFDTVDIGGAHNRGWKELAPAPEGEVNVIKRNQQTNEILVGFADGSFTMRQVKYQATFPDRGGREVKASIDSLPVLKISTDGHPIVDVGYGNGPSRRLAVALLDADGKRQLHAVTLAQQRTMFGAGEISIDQHYDLTDLLVGEPKSILVPWEADGVIVSYADGRIQYLVFEGGAFNSRQIFTPFADYPDPRVATIDYLLGDVSIFLTNPDGEARVWSVYRNEATGNRIFGLSKSFDTLTTPPAYFSLSNRNKAFLIGRGNFASLRFMTTESTRWEEHELPFDARLGIIAPRYNRLLFLDQSNRLHLYDVDDPHPSAGWKTYFGKIRYEGQAEASYTWQSTGGRDDFEPKMSMIPLIIGTLKGTIYAMLFAVPIALMAALYTSQFLEPKIKRYVKPTMEIMASLPSVVLGFIAALWLAPIVSNAVPSVMLATGAIFFGTLLFGYAWNQLPNTIRMRTRPGWEFLYVLPVVVLLGWLGWELGPVLERHVFYVIDPTSGLKVPSFRLWYPEFFGLAFEQRNAFVVGFVMGFAVIPIIFTISEDSLTNVPESFRSGALALGASRWQTAIRIVLPTASAGIFSALMIGLGRAVGETMIVVMATGNVATTELNPFTGMRTLSANIAVELPEAPYLGTLYRSLFFGALLLFLLTFMVNTAAEIMRQKLRERYRAVE